MKPHEFSVAETREWLDHARADLRACAILIAGGLPGEAFFHAQQCAEKL
jgi:HEPN domain-containing protein